MAVDHVSWLFFSLAHDILFVLRNKVIILNMQMKRGLRYSVYRLCGEVYYYMAAIQYIIVDDKHCDSLSRE